jgi:hypothetical protein
MKSIFICIIILIMMTAVTAVSEDYPINATTTDGRTVVLYPEGTWDYVTSDRGQSQSSAVFEKPEGATSAIKSKKGLVEVWYDSSKWNLIQTSTNDDAEFMLEHATEDCFALVIVERISMTLETLRNLAVENARAAGSSVDVVEEEVRRINGRNMLVMGIEGIIEGIMFHYQGYYWAGKSGAVQVVAFTGSNLFGEYRQDIDDLLNGTMILAD